MNEIALPLTIEDHSSAQRGNALAFIGGSLLTAAAWLVVSVAARDALVAPEATAHPTGYISEDAPYMAPGSVSPTTSERRLLSGARVR